MDFFIIEEHFSGTLDATEEETAGVEIAKGAGGQVVLDPLDFVLRGSPRQGTGDFVMGIHNLRKEPSISLSEIW